MAVADLNRAQRAAVKTMSGPLLVLAGAGTGKTRVITYRIAELIRSGIRADRILAVTFTNKAAKEMRHRALELLGKRRKNAKQPEISTFHSLCVRILRRHATKIGYPAHFVIYDRGDQETVARSALREIRVGTEQLGPSELLNQISAWKSRSVRAERAAELVEGDRTAIAASAYERYQTSLRASGAVDFDDLLLLTEQLFEDCPEARYAEATRFDHLLIDEYQDTNALQYRIVLHLARRHRNLCVVGDDDQSIYGWRGAEVEHILNFKKDWPDAKVVKLEDNYRCQAPIIDLANTLIRHNSTRHDKVLRAYKRGGEPPRFARFDDETQEAEAVVREIRRKIDAPSSERTTASDIAILFRTNEQPRAFETELRRERIPYVLVGGQSFYDRREVRDILSYLRVLANPSDEVSMLRIINVPARGIGAGSVQTLVELAVKRGEPLWSALPTALESGLLPPPVAERVAGFRQLIDSYRKRSAAGDLAHMLTELVEGMGYRAELRRVYPRPGDAESRWKSIEELINAVAQYESRAAKPSLAGFLEEVALSGREDNRDAEGTEKRQEHAVTLMTLHSAKGLEFPHVYLVGMEEGLLPHQRSIADGANQIAEERRLCYVGVTRAKESLTLTMAKARMKWGKPQPAIPSRFVLEMRGDSARALAAAQAAETRLAKFDSAGSDTRGQPRAMARKVTSKKPAKKAPTRRVAGSTRARAALKKKKTGSAAE
jgi:DNA helicase-2/ATP-dependent DNA helicase PcrA